MSIPYLLIARHDPAHPNTVMAWRTTLLSLAGDIKMMHDLGYLAIEARRLEE